MIWAFSILHFKENFVFLIKNCFARNYFPFNMSLHELLSCSFGPFPSPLPSLVDDSDELNVLEESRQREGNRVVRV